MIQRQQDSSEPPRFYAYCACGVCGPPRRTIEAARRDDEAHAEVCRERKT